MEQMQIHSSDRRNNLLKNVPISIPFGLLSRENAMRNHGQTLERLNQRGGIGIGEALDIIDGGKRRWKEDTQADVDELNMLIKTFEQQN